MGSGANQTQGFSGFAGRLGTGLLKGAIGETLRSAEYGADYEANWGNVALNAFGQAVGNSIVGEMNRSRTIGLMEAANNDRSLLGLSPLNTSDNAQIEDFYQAKVDGLNSMDAAHETVRRANARSGSAGSIPGIEVTLTPGAARRPENRGNGVNTADQAAVQNLNEQVEGRNKYSDTEGKSENVVESIVINESISNNEKVSAQGNVEEIKTGTGNGVKTNAVTTVIGKNGRRYYNNLDSEDSFRGFSKDPLSEKALTESQKANQFSGELDVRAKYDILNSEIKINLLEGADDLLILESNSNVSGTAKLDGNSLTVGGEVKTKSSLQYGRDRFVTDLGTLAVDAKTTVEAGLETGVKIDQHGLQVEGRFIAEAVLLQASGSFEAKKLDLYFFDVTVRADGDLNAGGIGGALGGGVVVDTSKVRVKMEAGATALIGARARLGIDINFNQSNIQRVGNVIGSAYQFVRDLF